MTKFTSSLNDLKVASPCEESWESMLGNERQRYCGRCQLNVYNLSGMSQAEAERLVSEAEGRLCVRFYKRADGSVITQDCPVGWARVKNRAKVLATAAFSLLLSLFSGLMFASYFSKSKEAGNRLPSILSTPKSTPADKVYPLMGDVAPMMGNVSVKPTPSKREVVGKMVVPIKEETKRKALAANN